MGGKVAWTSVPTQLARTRELWPKAPRGLPGETSILQPGRFPPYSAPRMQILINILLVIHVLVSLLIVLFVLMQRPKNEGLGAAFGGGMTENLFGAQTTNVLQTITRWLGCIFFALSLGLSILYVKAPHKGGVKERLGSLPVPVAAATPAPADAQQLQDAIKKAIGEKTDGAAPADVKPGAAPATPAPEAPAPAAEKPAVPEKAPDAPAK